MGAFAHYIVHSTGRPTNLASVHNSISDLVSADVFLLWPKGRHRRAVYEGKYAWVSPSLPRYIGNGDAG